MFSTKTNDLRCPFQKGCTCPTTYDVNLGRNDGPCMSTVGRSLHFWHSGDFGLRAARLLTSLSKAHGTNHSPDFVTYATWYDVISFLPLSSQAPSSGFSKAPLQIAFKVFLISQWWYCKVKNPISKPLSPPCKSSTQHMHSIKNQKTIIPALWSRLLLCEKRAA